MYIIILFPFLSSQFSYLAQTTTFVFFSFSSFPSSILLPSLFISSCFFFPNTIIEGDESGDEGDMGVDREREGRKEEDPVGGLATGLGG
jgi:hypothetical protein